MAASARSIGVAPERLRSYVTRTGVARKEHRRWSIGPDHRQREMLVYSEGRAFVVKLRATRKPTRSGTSWGRWGSSWSPTTL